MKCPKCDAATDVTDTRLLKDNTVKRKRLCHNEHGFVTIESIPQFLKVRSVIKENLWTKGDSRPVIDEKLKKRNALICASKASAEVEALIHNITARHVRLIRRQCKKPKKA